MTTTSQLQEPVLPTSKAASRRPALVRKRDDAEMDGEVAAAPLSPTKRAKVSFSNEVEVRVLEDWQKAPALIREEVKRALERHGSGDSEAYHQLLQIYKADATAEEAPTPEMLQHYTSALISNISLINRSCGSLVQAVLSSPWASQDGDYALLFVRFQASLVSAQGVWLGEVIQCLVENMTRTPPSFIPLSTESPITRSLIYRRAHAGLRYLVRLNPSTSSVLSSVLSNNYPDTSDSLRAHTCYVKNLLRICDYTPELRLDILSLITDRLVKIDVQVQTKIEELAEDVGDGLVQGIGQIPSRDANDDDDDDDDSDTGSEASEASEDPETERAREITRNVTKMDAILEALFSHYAPSFVGVPSADRDLATDMLLSQFSTIILPTYRSRHTQFLLFHFLQTSPDLVDIFVGTCIHLAFDKSRPGVIRQSAAAYLASFVARGIHVPSQVVRDVVDYLGEQLAILRAQYEPTCRGPDLRRYSTFYSLVQALMYIFCFRWRALEVSTEDFDVVEEHHALGYQGEDCNFHNWMPGLKSTLEANIFSKLNPLRVCAPTIVAEFARVARHLSIIYVYHLLESNKRLRLSSLASMGARETALSARKDEASQQLDVYFPFDPYHLPRSRRWVDADYREWKGIPEPNDAQDSETADEEGEEEDSGDEEATETDDGHA